jgi:outer membrane protein insertion porin family
LGKIGGTIFQIGILGTSTLIRSVLQFWVRVSITSFLIGVSVVSALAQEQSIFVKLVEIQGNHRIEDSTIRAKLQIEEGGLFDCRVIQEDIRAIFQLGYFEDVQVKSEGFEGGIKIIYVVSERPFVSEIQFEGYDGVTLEDLNEQISLEVDNFFDEKQLKSDVEKVKKYYEEEGLSNAKVVPVVKVLDEERVKVIFLIEEGEKVLVREIRFEGNEAFSSKKLKKELATREYFWLTSWLTESGRYKKDQLLIDAERLREVYLNNGYLEVQVGEPKVEINQEEAAYILTFSLIEGKQYTVEGMGFRGNKIIGDSELKRQVETAEGEVFRRNVLRRDIGVLTDAYGEIGYAFANIVPQMQPNPETQKVFILFEVTEGKPVKVGRINVYGNDKTRDKVIRREIRMDEQELINTKGLKRSFQRLNNLNFFETVEILPEGVSEDQMDLNVRVKEKATGSFSVGGGYSSVDNLVGIFELSQGNLFGRGQLLRAKAEFGSRRNTYSLTFREPYLLDYPISGTTNIFKLERDFDTYEEKRVGGDVILGKSITEYVSGSVSYKYEELELFNIDSTNPIITAQEGKQSTSSVGLQLSYDSRDNFLDTREGMRNSISFEFAGTGLGGSNDFLKVVGDSSKYFPLWWDMVFLIHGRLGYGTGLRGKDLPLSERFYVGGINTVRGFDFGKAGPREEVTVVTIDPVTSVITSTSVPGEVIGGDQELIFNFEYIVPLVKEANIKGVLFFDAGRGYDNSLLYSENFYDFRLRYSWGFGIRWISPVGPLRLEWGFNLDPREGEKAKTLEFSIGTLF